MIIGRKEALLDLSQKLESGESVPDVILWNELRMASEAIAEMQRRLDYAEKFYPNMRGNKGIELDLS